MEEPSARLPETVGRDDELALLRAFVTGAAPERLLVIEGPPGAGKTTLWRHAVEWAGRAGVSVLQASASAAEASMPFVTLADVLGGIAGDRLAGLPDPQRRALDAALLRVDHGGAPAERRAVGAATQSVLQAVASSGPVLIAIDDLQWVDQASADALAFALRRATAIDLWVLAARRPGRQTAIEVASESRGIITLPVVGLSLGALRRVLDVRLGVALSRRLIRLVHAISLGNPLFALEIGRRIAAEGAPSVGDELALPQSLDDLLGARVRDAPASRPAVLAVALGGSLTEAEVVALSSRAALDAALEAGLLARWSDRIAPAHPLYAAAAIQITSVTERREVHAALAASTRDPVRRGRHLAAAATGPDERLADDIAEGATRAFERGGIAEAEELAELALRRTPRDDPRRDDRVLELGRYLYQANELARLRKLLEAEADSLALGRARAHAHLLQAHVPASQDEYEAHLQAVLAGDADEDHRLQALVGLSLDRTVSFLDRLDEGQAQADRAMALASDPFGVAKARYALAWVRVLRGQPLESVDHAIPSGRALYGYGGELAEVVGVQLAARGDLEAARVVLRGVMDRAAAIGDEANWYAAHQKSCELELRAGQADRAETLIQEQIRQDWEIRVGLRATLIRDQAHLAMLRGDHAAARDLVARVHEVIHGQRWDALAADSVLAAAELLAGRPAAALDAGLRTWRHCEREGVDDIGLFPVAPDVVEASLALGEVSVALDVTDRLARLAEAQDHPWGLASTSRCRAMLALSSGDDEPARDALLSAATRYDELGCRFDAARTLLALGRHARRHRRWAVARDALQRAADGFRALGCEGWAADADGLMAGLGGRRPAARDRLTPTEQRAAELASQGRSNKEIAAAMFVGVHTVEVHLGRAYAKLGVQSRAQLARALGEREPGSPIN